VSGSQTWNSNDELFGTKATPQVFASFSGFTTFQSKSYEAANPLS
jgi:hypothetical protein